MNSPSMYKTERASLSDILSKIPELNNLNKCFILYHMMFYFTNLIWFYDYTLNKNLSLEILQTKKQFFDDKIKPELLGNGCRETIPDEEWEDPDGRKLYVLLKQENILQRGSINIIFQWSEKYYKLPILSNLSDTRLPFFYPKTNNGIEWFFLVYLLSKVTNLKDGDLFKFQAADIKNYTENYINTYILTEFGAAENFLNVLNKSIDSIFNGKNISINFVATGSPSSKNGPAPISVLYLDTNDYINNTINNKIKEDSSSSSPAAKLYNVLFEDMLKEYNKLIDMEEETSDRLFTIFSITQLKSMKKTIPDFKTFLNALPSDSITEATPQDLELLN